MSISNISISSFVMEILYELFMGCPHCRKSTGAVWVLHLAVDTTIQATILRGVSILVVGEMRHDFLGEILN